MPDLARMQTAGNADDAQQLLAFCAKLCIDGGASCAVALAQGGLLRAAVDWAARMTASRRSAASRAGVSVRSFNCLCCLPIIAPACSMHAMAQHSLGIFPSPLLPAQVAAAYSVPLVLKGACQSLDAAAGTEFCTEYAALLGQVPDPGSLHLLKPNVEKVVEDGETFFRAVSLDSPEGQRTLAAFRAQAAGAAWRQQFSQRDAWRDVQRSGGLLPAVLEKCAAAAADRATENAMLRDIAISAVSCCRLDCPNLAGAWECELRLRTCGKCGEARYCSRCG